MEKTAILTIEEKMEKILQRLKREFPLKPRQSRDPFSTLIAVILSQNTSDTNSSRAFDNLRKGFEIKPEVLAQAAPEEIKSLIRVAGLQEIKSHRIVEVSKAVIEMFAGDLNSVIRLPLHEARATLMGIRGIGPKSTDVLLAFVGDKPVVPVDTNIFRVAERIGLVRGRNYERTRTTLERYIPTNDRKVAHLQLIKLGRTFCRALRPRCETCPINDLCEKRIN